MNVFRQTRTLTLATVLAFPMLLLVSCGGSDKTDDAFCAANARIDKAVSAAADPKAVAAAVAAHKADVDLLRANVPSAIEAEAKTVIAGSDAMIASGDAGSVADPAGFLAARAAVVSHCAAEAP